MTAQADTPPVDVERLVELRATNPTAITSAWAERARRPLIGTDGRLLLVAADHPARGALGVGAKPTAMASRRELLTRLSVALAEPGVDGVLGTADILDDLLLMGLLEHRVVIGSMNRAGLHGASFEFDDRFTGYRASDIARLGLDGGKMLTRIALADPATAATLEASARAVNDLAGHGVMAMVEPFWSERDSQGRVRNLLDPDSVIKSIQVASGLAGSSAHTWLKVPVVEQMARVLEATTLPTLLLGGDPSGSPEQAYDAWGRALACVPARGLVVGRSLLYPPDDDVPAAVQAAVRLVHPDAVPGANS